MGNSSILPFATGLGANVLSDAAYAADPQTVIGQQPGLAKSAQNNKALRQATVIAAAVAQFIAQGQAADIDDSLDTTDIVNYLTEALGANLAPTLRNQSVTAFLTAGTGAAYTLDTTPDLAAYVANQTRFNVRFHTANTTTNPTLNVDGLGAVPIKLLGAGNVPVDPVVGQIPAGFFVDLMYNGAAFVALGGGTGAGATGGGGDEVFYENDTNVTASYSITAGKNATPSALLLLRTTRFRSVGHEFGSSIVAVSQSQGEGQPSRSERAAEIFDGPR